MVNIELVFIISRDEVLVVYVDEGIFFNMFETNSVFSIFIIDEINKVKVQEKLKVGKILEGSNLKFVQEVEDKENLQNDVLVDEEDILNECIRIVMFRKFRRSFSDNFIKKKGNGGLVDYV